MILLIENKHVTISMQIVLGFFSRRDNILCCNSCTLVLQIQFERSKTIRQRQVTLRGQALTEKIGDDIRQLLRQLRTTTSQRLSAPHCVCDLLSFLISEQRFRSASADKTNKRSSGPSPRPDCRKAPRAGHARLRVAETAAKRSRPTTNVFPGRLETHWVVGRNNGYYFSTAIFMNTNID